MNKPTTKPNLPTTPNTLAAGAASLLPVASPAAIAGGGVRWVRGALMRCFTSAAVLLVLAFSATGASAQTVSLFPSGSGANSNEHALNAGRMLELRSTVTGLGNNPLYQWTPMPPMGATFPDLGISFTDFNEANLTITASRSARNGATFQVQLGVRAGAAEAPTIISRMITISNVSPTADAGSDQTVNEGTTVTLDGTGSDDPDGANFGLTYLWTRTAGPDVNLNDRAAAQPTFTIPDIPPSASAQTSLTFSLRVSDPNLNTATDTVRIFIRPLFQETIDNPDNYSAGNEIMELTLPTALTVTGGTNTYTLSSVPPGLSLNNRTLSGTPTGTMRTQTFSLIYTATNGDGDTDSLPFNITVTNAPPTGAPTISGDLVEDEELTVTANTNIINDANGFEILSEGAPPEFTYQWNRRNGTTDTPISGETDSTYTLTMDDIGEQITVTASFTDGGGRQESRTSIATAAVRAANEPPMASAGSNQTVNEGATVTLDGSGTSDPDIATGDTLTYLWAQTGGTTVTLSPNTAAISPTFTAPVRQTADDGELAFSLTVTDSENETSTATVTISVTNLPPTADAGDDQTVAEGSEVTLDGSGSAGLPGDGRTYAWTQTGGTTVSLTVSDTDPTIATFTAPVRQSADDGEFEFTLTVTDAAGGNDTDTVAISVSTDASVQKTVETINRFLDTRTRLILANQPNASRRINRLQPDGAAEQLNFATGRVSKLMPVEFNLLGLDSGNYQLATSLDRITRAAAHLQATQGATASHDQHRFDIWFEGGFHKFDGDAGSDGDFGIAFLGADYLLSPDLLVGGMLQYDSLRDRNDREGSESDGKGWMAGPYLTARLQENLYLDARVAGGGSDNDITPVGTYTDSFETTRWLVDISLSGELTQGSWTIRPNAALSYLTDQQAAYTNHLGSRVPSQTVSHRQFKFGPTLSKQSLAPNGWLYEPTLTLDAIYSEANASGGLGTTPSPDGGWRARLAPGISMTSPDGTRLSFTGTFDGIGQDDFQSWGLGIHLGMTF